MTPETAAGMATAKGIIGGGLSLWRDEPEVINEWVWTVEQEAVAAERARLRTAVEELPSYESEWTDIAGRPHTLIDREVVLALLGDDS